MSTRKRRGRPRKPRGQTKSESLLLRLQKQEKAVFKSAADLAGLDLSAWIRERLRKDAREELSAVGKEAGL